MARKRNYGGNVTRTLEKDEILETPDGKNRRIGGGTHESGNDTQVTAPEDSYVWSADLKLGDKSMADHAEERKKRIKKRTKKLKKILKDFKDNPNKIEKNTSERNIQKLIMEQQKDLRERMLHKQIQDYYNDEDTELEEGGYYKKMKGGGKLSNKIAKLIREGYDKDQAAAIAYNMEDGGEYQMGGGYNDPIDPLPNRPMRRVSDIVQPLGTRNTFVESPIGDLQAPDIGEEPIKSPTTPRNPNIRMGEWGNWIQALSPFAGTIANRIGDRPYSNFYEGYGQQALESISDRQQAAASRRDDALADTALSTASQRQRNRGSARSLNTMRALDQATTAQEQRAMRDIYGDYGARVANIMAERTNLLQDIDQMRRAGQERQREMNERQRDNFYTQLVASSNYLGEGLTNISRNRQQEAYLEKYLEDDNFGFDDLLGMMRSPQYSWRE